MSKNKGIVNFLVKLKKFIPVSGSDYDLYYPQYVDSKTPLSEMESDDLNGWIDADQTHLTFASSPSPDRTDYFDISYGTDPLQKLDIHHLNGTKLRPVIFFMHGGGWTLGDKSDSRYGGPTWVADGYTVVSVNYRLGPEHPHPAQIEDCALALKWVIDNIGNYGGDASKIAITGHSVGGHLAALLTLGTKWHTKYNIDISRVKCWIPISGVHDFSLRENFYHPFMYLFCGNLFYGLSDLEASKNDASPVTHITGNEPPGLIMHGGDDWLVPKTNATTLYNFLAARGVNIKLEITNNYWHCCDHANYADPNDKPSKVIEAFLKQYIPA